MTNIAQYMTRRGRATAMSATDLETNFIKYIEDTETRMYYKTEGIKSGIMAGELITIPVFAPPTVRGFCLFAGIPYKQFCNYMNPESPTYAAYNDLAEYIKDYCNNNVFEGAIAGVYNGNLAFAMLKKDLELASDNDGAQGNVGKIVHEITFSNFKVIQPEDVANTIDISHLNESPKTGEYDALPPRHSRDFNNAETAIRNNVVQEE